MLFNSFQFIVFFLAVTSAYFALPHRWRWVLLLAASYYFYMCWNAWYIIYIVVSTLVDWSVGIGMERSVRAGARRALLGCSLAVNLGMLFVFKYYGLFAATTQWALQHWNIAWHAPELRLLLPVGISFYVFQSLAYTIDVYRRKVTAERHLGIFALYVTFFPQLVAGPIERPQHLMGQFHVERRLQAGNVRRGLELCLWGIIKKVCIADLLVTVVDTVYAKPHAHAAPILLLATVFFAVQIYCDFSGYSDMARGVARIYGFELMQNFRQPYFALSVREFWQRWHISLSTWFRDYIYFPMGGNRVARPRWALNVMTVFLISGLWHGAAWTFVLWGGLHGIYLVAGEATQPLRDRIAATTGWARLRVPAALLRCAVTFALVLVGWAFFRATSFADGWYIASRMFRPAAIRLDDVFYGLGLPRFETALCFAMIALLIVVDAVIAFRPAPVIGAWNVRAVRWTLCLAGCWLLVFFGVWEQVKFIYFQF